MGGMLITLIYMGGNQGKLFCLGNKLWLFNLTLIVPHKLSEQCPRNIDRLLPYKGVHWLNTKKLIFHTQSLAQEI